MALRLVYQISCNVNKPTFLGNSTECLRRFRSVSPVFKSADDRCFSSCRSSSCNGIRQRSRSYPSKNLVKTDSPYLPKQDRSLSTKKGNENENAEEYYYNDETEFSRRSNQGQSRKTLQAKNSAPRLQIKKPQSAFKLQTKPSQAALTTKSKSAIKLNPNANQLDQYYLKDSLPEAKKNNVFNVFDYYSEQYRRQDSKVMPHLQPHNLKPYGTGENLVFPTHYKNRSIKYPVMESEYTTQVAKANQKKGETSGRGKNFSTSRDFCTTSTSDEQLQKCNQLLDEHNTFNPGYVPLNKKSSLAPGSLETVSLLQKTIKLISENKCHQINRKPKSVSSEDLKKCNQVISDYIKVNPGYQPANKEVKSGSQEEKQAVNKALNFAANFKRFYHNSKTQENQTSMLPLQSKTVSECLIKDHKKWSSKTVEKPVQSEEVTETEPDLLKRSFSLPNIQSKTFVDVFDLPEVPVVPIRVRVGPKANLLQSNASPEVASLWDNIGLAANEKLISPWPSYADQLKQQLGPKKDPREIVYPAIPDNSKILKNTKNIKIQAGNVQAKLELSTCSSMHKNMKFSTVKKVSVGNGESYSGQKGTISKNLHRSLPDLRYFVRGYSTPSKGTFCDEKTVPPKRSKSKDVCDTIEIESPPTTTDFFNSHDCKCVEQKLPLDVPPLTRPKKRSIPKEPPKICPVVKPCSTPRADAELKTKSKKLPKMIPAQDCPCVELKMKEGCPLPRLKKSSVKEPAKMCPPCTDIKCNCPPRADEGLKIKKKALPKLTPGTDCPCVDPIFTDVPPLKPLKKVKISEPRKICLVPRICDTPRADEKLKTKIKTLPKITASDCPCVEDEPLKTVPLARLKKVKIEEPPKICIHVKPCDNVRADGKLKVPQKSLPPLEPEECPCVEPQPPSNVKPLKRLQKRNNPAEPPRKCPKKENLCALPRADDKLKYGQKKLPGIKSATDCPCVELEMQEGCPLSRLKKACVEEPPKICPPCTDIKCNCPSRADQSLKIEKKRLPILKAEGCVCLDPKTPIDVPRLKPLKKIKIKEPGNECPPPPEMCSPRADDEMVTKSKKLPKLEASTCKCVEPEPLKTVPLPRPKKSEVCEPSNACPEEPDPCDQSETDRADEICKYKIKMKKLPPMLLKAENNHISLRGYTNKNKKTKGPKFNTYHKRKFSIYSKTNDSWKAQSLISAIDLNLGAINNYSRKLPKSRVAEAQDREEDITPKLKRLPKFEQEDIDWSKMKHCLTVCGSPRADVNWKSKKKCLPRLVATKCPRVDIKNLYSKKNQPTLKRLPKVKIKDVDWAGLQPCLPTKCKFTNPRADDTRKPRKKSLPKLNIDETPCMDQALANVAPLKRLPKFDKPDVNHKTNPKRILSRCGDAPRADTKLKEQAKTLPRLKPSNVFHIETKTLPLKEIKLKRLPKFRKPDVDWKAVFASHKTCPSYGVVPRADSELKPKNKSLPKLKSSECPSIDVSSLMSDVAPLKRLPKFTKADIKWKDFDHCKPTPCKLNPARADGKLKIKSRSLPKLEPGTCSEWVSVENKPSWQFLAKSIKNNRKITKQSLSKLNITETFSKDPQSSKADLTPPKLKFKKEGKDLKKPQTFTGFLKVDGMFKPKSKSLPEPRPRVEEPEDFEEDAPKLKRLVKLQEEEDPPKVCKYPNCGSSNERADELLGYEYKKKKLPPLLPALLKKGYHTVRSRRSYPIYPIYRDVAYMRYRFINTTPSLFKKNKTSRSSSKTKKSKKGKKCKKMEAKKEKSCPKQKSLPKCKPRARETCNDPYIHEECSKQKSPYPSFSECGEVAEWPKCECPDPDLKFLQPHYPIIKEIPLLTPAPPDHATIDVKKEKDCVMKKLGINDEGETKTCENFHDLPKEIKAKDLLKAEDEEKAEPKKCPAVSTETCEEAPAEKKEPTICALSKPKKKKKKKPGSSKPDGPPTSTDKSKNAGEKKDSKPSLKSSNEKKSKPSDKSKLKSASKSESKAKLKVASSSGPPAVIPVEKPKGIIDRILAFFSPKPKDTGKTVAAKKTEKTPTAAAQSPKESKPKDCPKPPKDFCQSRREKNLKCGGASKEKANKSKPPTKKGASKIKKKPIPKNSKTKKTETCEKVVFKCDTKEGKNPKVDKKSVKTKPDWQIKAEEKGEFAKKFKDLNICSTKSKDVNAENEIFSCPPDENDNSRFAKMFPPDMPDCTPRRRIRGTTPPPPLPKCIPMEACRRLLNSWKEGVIECEPELPKEPVCKVAKKPLSKPKAKVCKSTESASKPKRHVCKPKKSKTEVCKQKKSEAKVCQPKKSEEKVSKPKKSKKKVCKPKKVECKAKISKPEAELEKPPSDPKCQKVKSDCPPRERESCQNVYIFKKCKAQESPYPSFSECRPPFPKPRIDECLIARKRAKATLSIFRKNLKRKKEEDNDKGNKKGSRSYCTMSAVARAMTFHSPTQWRRYYSSNAGGRGPKYFSHTLDKAKKKTDNRDGKSSDVLNQRLLASIEEGIEKLESQDIDLPNNLYYQVLKALQKLSEKEVYDFFDQEAQFNPLYRLKSDVSETVSFVCKLNPRAEQTLFANNDINFQPRCVGISDPNALSEEMKVIEAFKTLCKKLCDEADFHDIPYEELELLKTEDMKRELDELLRKAQNNQQ